MVEATLVLCEGHVAIRLQEGARTGRGALFRACYRVAAFEAAPRGSNLGALRIRAVDARNNLADAAPDPDHIPAHDQLVVAIVCLPVLSTRHLALAAGRVLDLIVPELNRESRGPFLSRSWAEINVLAMIPIPSSLVQEIAELTARMLGSGVRIHVLPRLGGNILVPDHVLQ